MTRRRTPKPPPPRSARGRSSGRPSSSVTPDLFRDPALVLPIRSGTPAQCRVYSSFGEVTKTLIHRCAEALGEGEGLSFAHYRSFAADAASPVADVQVVDPSSPLRTCCPRSYCAAVRERILIAATLLLFGCGYANTGAAAQNDRHEAANLPLDQSTDFRNRYSLRVPRLGEPDWNGVSVDPEVLTSYLHEYAALPREAGPLYVAFEPGIAIARAASVRRSVIRSGLCQQHRCLEESWNMKRPVVN